MTDARDQGFGALRPDAQAMLEHHAAAEAARRELEVARVINRHVMDLWASQVSTSPSGWQKVEHVVEGGVVVGAKYVRLDGVLVRGVYQVNSVVRLLVGVPIVIGLYRFERVHHELAVQIADAFIPGRGFRIENAELIARALSS